MPALVAGVHALAPQEGVDSRDMGERSDAVLRTESGEFIIAVEDSGPGIDPQVAARMFEPFVTTKSSCMGTGLGIGLSICRSIVESHGGRLSIARPTRTAQPSRSCCH